MNWTSDDGGLEVIDLDDPDVVPTDVEGAAVEHAPRLRRSSLARVSVAIACVVAVSSAGLAWGMRGQRDAARRDARATVGEVHHLQQTTNSQSSELIQLQRALDAAGRARSAVIRESFVHTFAGVRGGRVTLLLAQVIAPGETTLAVLHVQGESGAVFRLGVDHCPDRGGGTVPVNDDGDPFRIVPGFPYIDESDEVAVHVFEWGPPPGQTADGVPPVVIGGVRNPFDGPTVLARDNFGCG